MNRIWRKKFVVVNRNNGDKNWEAIEASIKRYELKTGRTVSRNGMSGGNAFFKFEAYAYVTNDLLSFKNKEYSKLNATERIFLGV